MYNIFLTKLLILGILFSTAVINTDTVTKPLLLGILFSNSLTLTLYSDFLTSLQVLAIFFLTLFYLHHIKFFKTNPLVSILFILAN